MITTIVSARQSMRLLNGISRRVSASGDPDEETLVSALRADYRKAPIDERDLAMLDCVAQLTRDATQSVPATSIGCADLDSTTPRSSRSR